MAHIDVKGEVDPKHERRSVTVDRTSSMTAGEVERFWKLAMREFVEAVSMTMASERVNATEASLRVARGTVDPKSKRALDLDSIAKRALEDTIGREP